jgi:hypothetical protein
MQQRRGPSLARGLSDSGDFHERQARAVADALMQGHEIAGLLDFGRSLIPHSLQRQPASSAPPPLIYDRTSKGSAGPVTESNCCDG